MLHDQLRTFTDRREAIALFNFIRGRDISKPWSLLPILAFIGLGGSGKSTLIEYLRINECCLPDPQRSPILPYAHLDFTLAGAPRDLLSILVALRNQLQQHKDELGKNLTFPRFDFGAAIASAIPADGNLPSLRREEVQHRLSTSLPLFGALSKMGSALGNLGGIFAFIPPLIVGLQWFQNLPPLQEVLRHLEGNSGWHWYQAQSIDLELPANASISQVLLRLYELSIPGRPGRPFLIEQVLPAAFLADLCDALDGPDAPYAWSKTVNVVLFLDGFDVLLDGHGSTGIRLLEALACSKRRKQGKTDPLLLVLGSRERLLELTDVEQNPLFEHATTVVDEPSLQEGIQVRYTHWQQHLPAKQRFLWLKDLLLPVWMQDFGLEHTRYYLTRLGEREQTNLFTDDTLVHTIQRVTHGHPLYIALAAATALEAAAHGQHLKPGAFDQALVSPEVVHGHEDEPIGDYLLALFLRQLSSSEQQDLIFCAAPRTLDVGTLRAILQLPNDIEAQQMWEHYRRFAFVRAIDEQRLVLHPVVRALLLRRLPPRAKPESDYYQTHTRLRNHFHGLAHSRDASMQGTSDWHPQIEEAYHALALGDSEPAIRLGIAAQRENLALWEPLLGAVAQASTALIPEETVQLADQVLAQSEQYHNVKDGVTAIILYNWLLNSVRDDHITASRIQHNLGDAYRNLPGGDLQGNLQQAINYYQAALKVRTHEAFPVEWAATQNNLGNTYGNLPVGDRQKNLEQAITCYQQALKVYERKDFPIQWITVQNNLGNAYRNLPVGDRQKNLEQAITCYQQALKVCTREDFPREWAGIQNNLGNTYANLPGTHRQANLRLAISCYRLALKVYTREDFPREWAMTQNNLSNAYASLPNGDRQKNLEQAIYFYEAVLEVYTRADFPREWATTQYNLGTTYHDLLVGDRQKNLEQAISCLRLALEVYTREGHPREWAVTQYSLGAAYGNLPSGNRRENLNQALSYFKLAFEVFESMRMDDYIRRAKENIEKAQRELDKLGLGR